jgi:hypothetical protein
VTADVAAAGARNEIARFLTGSTSDDPAVQARRSGADVAHGDGAPRDLADPVAWIGVAESPDGRAMCSSSRRLMAWPRVCCSMRRSHLPLMMAWAGHGAVVQSRQRRHGAAAGVVANSRRTSNPIGAATRGGRRPQQATLQMHLSDYKAVNGIKFPFLIQSGANEETTEELVVKNIRINPSFKPEQFSK